MYNIWIIPLLQVIAISASISIDSFVAAFAYGCKKIKIPPSSIFIINTVCTFIIGISFLFGLALYQSIPEWLAMWLSFSILFIIGIVKLFDSITKSIIKKYTNLNKELNFLIFNFKLVLQVYAQPEAADVNISKSISAREAVLLAIALSLDGMAVGLSAAMIGVNGWLLVIFTFFTGILALLAGSLIGNKAADKFKFNISWIAGIIFIGLAFMQLF